MKLCEIDSMRIFISVADDGGLTSCVRHHWPVQILGISADTRYADLPEEIPPLFYAGERIAEIGFFKSSGILQNLQCFTFPVQLYFDPPQLKFPGSCPRILPARSWPLLFCFGLTT